MRRRLEEGRDVEDLPTHLAATDAANDKRVVPMVAHWRHLFADEGPAATARAASENCILLIHGLDDHDVNH